MPLKPKVSRRPGRPTRLHVTLTDTERHMIHGWLRSTTVATGQSRRARAVLLLADGRPLSQVAAMVGVARNSVYKYAARFLAQGVDGLRDGPRHRNATGLHGYDTPCPYCGSSWRTAEGERCGTCGTPRDPEPCPFCGAEACERVCAEAALAQAGVAFPRVQALAEHLYAAYVAGLGPLGLALPPWQDLIDRQQYAWRCVVRAGEETP